MTSIKETLKEGLNLEYEVIVPKELFEGKINKELDSISKDKKIKIDGFRSGNIPLSVVKSKYLIPVRQDTLQTTISESIDKIVKDNNLILANSPAVDKIDAREGHDISFTLKMEVMPEIKEPDFSTIILNKLECEASDEEVNDSLNNIVKANTSFSKVKEGKAANGDQVVIDFVGKIDSVPFANGSGNDHPLVLGSKTFIEGFEEQLIGLKKDDFKTISVTFPKDYHQADLAGQKAEFDVTIKEVREAEQLEANDEFAEKFGLSGLEELKSKISEQLSKQYNEISLTKIKKELFDALEPMCNFEIPKSIFDREYNTLWNQIPAKEKADTSKIEELSEKYKKLSERRVKLGLLLARLGEIYEVKISNEEIRQAVFEQAKNFPGQESKVIELYKNKPELLESLKGPILEDKVVDLILSKVQQKVEKVSSKKLLEIIKELDGN